MEQTRDTIIAAAEARARAAEEALSSANEAFQRSKKLWQGMLARANRWVQINPTAYQNMVAHLRDRLARCQEHNRQLVQDKAAIVFHLSNRRAAYDQDLAIRNDRQEAFDRAIAGYAAQLTDAGLRIHDLEVALDERRATAADYLAQLSRTQVDLDEERERSKRPEMVVEEGEGE